jgi:hypothetical protein
MDWLPENWTPVLNALRRGRRVVPVIGEALQLIPDEQGKPTPFVRILARRLFASNSEAERATVLEALGKKQSHAAEPSLHDLAVPFISRPMKFAERLRPLHEALLDEALAHIFPAIDPPVEQRHPLRLLAEIRGLPLYLTTTPDSLMKRVLAKVRGMKDEDVRGFQLVREKPERATTADLRSTLSWDLPPGWDPSPTTRPFLFHLFGRIDDPDGSARFDVTEEDHFEMLCRLQSETWWPEQLIWELKPSHVLLLGQPLADWHARFFLRLLRGQRLSAHDGDTTSEAVVDSQFTPGPQPAHYDSLAVFLDTFSGNTRIYRDGSPERFIQQLHEKWTAIQSESVVDCSASDLPQPADLAMDGVFISYHSPDRDAAELLAESLRSAGVKTYLDKSRGRDAAQPGLESGSKWREKLEQNVNAAVFVLLITSRNTQKGGFFRTEWAWACEKDKDYFGISSRGYLRPIIVDESSMGELKDIPKPFRDAHVVSLPDGKCTPAFLADFLVAFEKWRAKA